MQDNIIKKIYVWIKKYKVVLVVLFLMVVSILITKTSETKKEIPPVAEPTPKIVENNNFTYDQSQLPKYKKSDEAFLMNMFNTPERVISYTWRKNEILYATESGIFSLFNNSKMISANIKSAYFSDDGSRVLIHDNSNYTLTNIGNQESKKINITTENIKTEANLNYILYLQDNLLKILDTNNQSSTTILESSSYFQFAWIGNKNKFYVYYPDTQKIEVFDNNLQKTLTKKIPQGRIFLSISPDQNSILTYDEKRLYISNANEIEFVSNFDNIQELKINWIDENRFIATEKIYLSELNIFDQYLWIIDTKGNKSYFSNSVPMTKKISDSAEYKSNADKTAILTIDTAGNIWVFSLVSRLIPTYTEEGLFLYNLPEISREDYH